MERNSISIIYQFVSLKLSSTDSTACALARLLCLELKLWVTAGLGYGSVLEVSAWSLRTQFNFSIKFSIQ